MIHLDDFTNALLGPEQTVTKRYTCECGRKTSWVEFREQRWMRVLMMDGVAFAGMSGVCWFAGVPDPTWNRLALIGIILIFLASGIGVYSAWRRK